MMAAFVIIDSASFAATSTPISYAPGGADSNVQNPPLSHIVRVWADVPVNVAVDGDATADSMPVAAFYEGVLLSVPPGRSVSAVKMSGAADGTVWLTTVKRA